jgi:hypothetical protein
VEIPEKLRQCTPGDKKHESSELNYYTFGDDLKHLGINSLSFPIWMLCTKNDHTRQKTLNSGSDLTE